MRILFWGTPDFALPSLRAMESEGHTVVGVVTQPDRPAGRGRRARVSPVKEAAVAEKYPILEPERPRGPAFLEKVDRLEPDLSVVVAYGHILVSEVLERPRLGSVNVHASLLPALRGAAPVNWAIARGHDRTGVTIMRMTAGMDAGPILIQAEEAIGPDDTASDLSARLAEVGAELLIEALALLEADAVEEREQDHASATFAPKVTRETARIQWGRSAKEVGCHIRGMDAVPGAWSLLEGEPIKLFRPTPSESAEGEGPGPSGPGDVAPGTLVSADAEGGLVVATGRSRVSIAEVQPAGRRRMPAGDWLRGRGAEVGQRFE